MNEILDDIAVPPSTAKGPKLKWTVAIGAGVLIFALSCVLSEHHRQFKVPGSGAKVCYLLGRWGDSSGFKEIAKKVFRLGWTLDDRRIQRAFAVRWIGGGQV